MTRPIAINEPDDPRIAAYRDIRERDLVGREGHFIAEGEVVVRRLIGGGSLHTPVSLLIAEKRAAGLADIIERLPDTVPVYIAGQAVMDTIAGFPMHRGILALGRRGGMGDADGLLAAARNKALIVVLMAIANHDNMGGIFRNAAAFGADAVILDSDCCDPLYRKAIRVSGGNVLTVPFARLERGETVLHLLARHGFAALALSPRAPMALADYRRPGKIALLLGAEGPGLPPAILDKAEAVCIPMAAGVDSLNVATTSGIALYHLTL